METSSQRHRVDERERHDLRTVRGYPGYLVSRLLRLRRVHGLRLHLQGAVPSVRRRNEGTDPAVLKRAARSLYVFTISAGMGLVLAAAFSAR
ncbi:hypothetical protein J7E99_11850 [Streptomyces sp. ISL-44]|uniref:hypothetical protein n=1 Tax=Streptomyces sp. ISL-44 TaxID=2819184 RepID=UPI001BE9F3EE|nr:hypothetical protein [Streptomyces sp. ISL-44]MBT2541384.1 hypothetical protein [Streptomyces sp. ISL-44]